MLFPASSLFSFTGTAGGLLLVLVAAAAGAAGAYALYWSPLRWTWTVPALMAAVLIWPLDHAAGAAGAIASLTAMRLARRWHRRDVFAGGDIARAAAARRGVVAAVLAAWRSGGAARAQAWCTAAGMLVGLDVDGADVRIPLGGRSGATHTLVVGATGSGKTVSQTWIVLRCLEQGMGAVVIDPKGDALLAGELARCAARLGRPLIAWSPAGPAFYNPLARGSETEIVDKALAGERFTEPHYLRQAQRYMGHAVRILRACGRTPSLAALVDCLDPRRLELLARNAPEAAAQATFAYLDSLTGRQARDLAGVRDRLAVLAESDAARWLGEGDEPLDLLDAMRARAVVYFSLEADRRPLLAQMLGAAIVQDLITVVGACQAQPLQAVVAIDEFAALAAEHVTRLFGRARSAGVSLVLATQELADLRPPGRPALLDQVLGNLGALIAHRQVVPESASLIATIAGTRGAWSGAVRPDGEVTRTRTRELAVHPDQIRALQPGCAAVIVPGGFAGGEAVRLATIMSPQLQG